MNSEEEFLSIDFAQSYEQLRQYNESIRRVFEFAFGGIVAVASATAVLIEKYPHPSVFWFVAGLLISSSLAATLLYFSYARNRIYFVKVARFVNEIRFEYLKREPLGFQNTSGMWCDPKHPAAFDLFSSQVIEVSISILLYGLAFGIGVGLLWPLLLHDTGHTYVLVPGVIGFLLYVGCCFTLLFTYLHSQDKLQPKSKQKAQHA